MIGQVDPLVLQPQLGPYAFTTAMDGVLRQVKQNRDFFGGSAVFNEFGHLGLGEGQPPFQYQSVKVGFRGKLGQDCLDALEVECLVKGKLCFSEVFQVPGNLMF